jgi:hypothetical protein
MHPLCINIRLHEVSTALLHKDRDVTDDEQQQLRYANMLIDVSQNQNSRWCKVAQEIADDTKTLGVPNMRYTTESNQILNNDALNWLYQDAENFSFNQTILCSTNASVDHWNAIAQ